MKPKHKRACWIIGLWLVAAAGLMVVLNQFEKHLLYFYSPSDVLASPPADGRALRLGGLVVEGSVERLVQQQVRFAITDGGSTVQIHYDGMLPALFREGQGVVMEGLWQQEYFDAETILTKHDENYMPPEVARSLKEQGHWKGETPPPSPAPEATP